MEEEEEAEGGGEEEEEEEESDTQWVTKPVYKHREIQGLTSAGHKSHGLGKGLKCHHARRGFLCSLEKAQYSPAPSLLPI